MNKIITNVRPLFENRMKASSDMNKFKEIVKKAKHVVALTGAGISAESGVPTFRGAGGYWRQFQAQQLATLQAFRKDPSLVWEFYHYRREVVLTKEPNPVRLIDGNTDAEICGYDL